jgi:hypothetical protein
MDVHLAAERFEVKGFSGCHVTNEYIAFQCDTSSRLPLAPFDRQSRQKAVDGLEQPNAVQKSPGAKHPPTPKPSTEFPFASAFIA